MSMKPMMALMLTLLVYAAPGMAELKSQAVPYGHDGVQLEGYLVYDAAKNERKGAVLLVHEWWGLNEYIKMRADKLAELGYIAFAVDMYGAGQVTDDPKQAGEWAGAIYADRALARARVNVGLEVFRKTAELEAGAKVAAIGYCFGGTTVMELAYSGAPVAGVVSFHGNPNPPMDGDTIEASIMICHGDADALVSDESLDAVTQALNGKAADWMLIRYAGAKHAFTNPNADAYGLPPVSYDAPADARSWAQMQAFFDELFAE